MVAAAAVALLVAALVAAAAVGGKEYPILAAAMAARAASASVIFENLRYDGNWMAAGTVGSTLKSSEDKLAVFLYLLVEPSSGKRAAHGHVIHGGQDLLDVAWMTAWADHHWSGGRRRNVSHSLHGACVLWRKDDVSRNSHLDATCLHLAARHSHDRCV